MKKAHKASVKLLAPNFSFPKELFNSLTVQFTRFYKQP